MNIKQYFARKLQDFVTRNLSLTDPNGWRGWGGRSTYAGKSVTEDSAMQMSAVWGCVRVLSECIGSLPWAIYQRDDQGNAEKAPNHNLTDVLIYSPNADMTDVEFRESLIVNLALQGNAYSLREDSGKRVVSLYPIPAQLVSKQRLENGEIQFKVLDRGKYETYPQDKIWHVPGFGYNGLAGLSPISFMRQAIGLGLATEEYGSRFFAQGATTSGVIKLPNWLNKEQRESTREILKQGYEGLGNSHKLMLLEGGMDYTSVSMPLEDAQFLETRKFQVNEIARIFRIPPHLIADLDKATFSNIEQMSIEFVMFTLQPYLTRIERSVSKWLLSPADRRKYFLKFNLDGLLRGDTAARKDYYATMLQNGVYSRNEVRALENMNRIKDPAMDEYTVQSNMAPIDALESLFTRAPSASEPKAGDINNFTVNMPENVKHAIAQSVEVPGVKELADEVKRGNALNGALVDMVRTELKEIKSAAEADRIVIYDKAGQPIGTRAEGSLMAAGNKFNSFVEAVAEKVHNLGSDTLKVMLSNVAPSAANTKKADLTEIASGNGYTAGGTQAGISASAQSGGLYKLVLNDVVFTASGAGIGPFRYAILYNDTATNDEVIAWWDYGSSISLASGETFTWDADPTSGVLTLT